MNKNDVNYDLYNGLYTGDVLYYNKKYNAHERYQYLLQKKILKFINPKNIKSIADIGCGAGVKTFITATHFTNVTVLGTDFAEQGIKKANEHFKEQKNLNYSVKNVLDKENLEKYDLITAFEIAEHIEDWKGFISDICNATNKYIVLSFPTGRMRKYEDKIGHCRNFKKGEVELFLKEQGFKPIKIYNAGFPFWSPLSRDLLNLVYDDRDHTSSMKINKYFHNILYILYKYFTSKNIGDQFIGVFERE